MTTFTATDVKNNFGEVMEQARREPVTITKSGRPAVAMIDILEYQRLRRLEDAHWADLADKALESGFVGQEETMKLLSGGLRAEESDKD